MSENLLDIYYRAFKAYRSVTLESAACARDRKALALSNIEADKLQATKFLCNIDETWVKAIEEGLEYFEKAVAEQRQFIRSDGEVVPIEKVKKTSKETVVHLAKHSDLITRVPENEDDTLVPDKLYMVEKDSDFAVYENRFLYMALCYLRDFINFRLEKIEALRHKYIGKMQFTKQVVTKKRKLTISADVDETREDNPFPIADEQSDGLLERIKNCQQIVTSLLNTDLMTQVAKSPILKPPVVKTNVLKMNNNFKHALALYDYVASYKDTGYTFDTVKYDLTPFTETLADVLAESANLLQFLSFMYGNGIEGMLETAYRAEENRRRLEEAERLDERLARLKKRAFESDKTLEEYALLLEERNRMLVRDSEQLQEAQSEIVTLHRQIDALQVEQENLNRRIEMLYLTISEKEEEIDALNQKFADEIAALKREHEERFAQAQQDHADELIRLQAQHDDAMRQTVTAYEAQIAAVTNELTAFRTEYTDTLNEYKTRLESVQAREEGLDATIKQLTDAHEEKIRELEKRYASEAERKQREFDGALAAWEEENLQIRTELDGLRMQHGLLTPSTDYTSRERFVELEAEYEAFKRFFKGQWKITKKAIRREVYRQARDNSGTSATEE